MTNMVRIKELAKEALDDETTVNRGRWWAVLNLANDNEILGEPVTSEDLAWAERRIQELKAKHCLPFSE